MSWDDIWKEKKHVTDFSIRWEEFLSSREKLLPRDGKILEARCGSGRGIAIFAKDKRTAIGLDISDEAVSQTAAHKNVIAMKGDNFALPFSDNTFDLVFNSGVIEHFKYPDDLRQVKEMARVAKRGGEVIINVPNTLCAWYISIKRILQLMKKWKYGYEGSYTPRRLKRTVKEANLRVVGLTGFLCLPPLSTHESEVLPFNIRKKLASAEKFLPLKEYYCYSVCAICRKG